MACLGELLFYFSNVDTPSNPAQLWPQAAKVVHSVTNLLSPEDDAYARHYAAKTIDNLVTGSGFWVQCFCTENVALALLKV